MLPAHDPADIVDLRVVGDHGHAGIERIGLLVQRLDRLALARLAGDDRAGQLGEIVDMRRTPEGEHQVIGAIDQRADRPLARGFEAALHPGRARAVGHARNGAGVEGRTTLLVLDTDIGRDAFAFDPFSRDRFQCPQPRRREIARDAEHAHAIGPVGRDRHVEHGRNVAVIGERRADRGIIGQFDDPVMLLAQFEFAHRAHHPVRFDAADCALAQFHPVRGHDRTGQAEHALHARTRIRRAAHDLQGLRTAGGNAQHLQFVGVGVRAGGQHFGHAETGELFRRVLDPFDLVADTIERGGNVLNRRIGFEEIFQPFEREFHARAPTPADRVGWSKGEKP